MALTPPCQMALSAIYTAVVHGSTTEEWKRQLVREFKNQLEFDAAANGVVLTDEVIEAFALLLTSINTVREDNNVDSSLDLNVATIAAVSTIAYERGLL